MASWYFGRTLKSIHGGSLRSCLEADSAQSSEPGKLGERGVPGKPGEPGKPIVARERLKT